MDPRERLLAHDERMLTYKAQQRLATGEAMRRREFIALAGASVAWPFAALAQEPGRTYRLGVLLPQPRDVPVNVAFLEEFRRRGFIEGKNLTVEWRTFAEHVASARNFDAFNWENTPRGHTHQGRLYRAGPLARLFASRPPGSIPEYGQPSSATGCSRWGKMRGGSSRRCKKRRPQLGALSSKLG